MSEEVQPTPPAPVPWSDEAREFLAELEDTSRAAGFIVKDGFACEPNQCWEAVMTLNGKLGEFELRIWTTPALAALEQWRLRLIPMNGGIIMSFVPGVAMREFDYLLRYLRAVAQVAESMEGVRNALRYAKDPRYADAREQLLAYARGTEESRQAPNARGAS